MRIRAKVLHRLLPRLPELERFLSRFAYLQTLQLEQLAACNLLHEVKPRLARWLLMAADRSLEEDLPLTHKQLARLLGSRRASVSVAANTLQELGAIKYERGTMYILNRRKLEEASCECYEIVHAHFESYFHP
jgi:CRP-like cAMP-binding protein